MSGTAAGLRARLRLERDEGQVRPRVYQGSRLVWECDVRNRQTGVLTDVDGARALWRDPGGGILTVPAARVSVGLYRCALAVAQPGIWQLRFEAAYPAIETDERSFEVLLGGFADPSPIAGPVLLTPDLRLRLTMDGRVRSMSEI